MASVSIWLFSPIMGSGDPNFFGSIAQEVFSDLGKSASGVDDVIDNETKFSFEIAFDAFDDRLIRLWPILDGIGETSSLEIGREILCSC